MGNNSSRLQAQEQLQQQTTPAAFAKPHKLISIKRRKPSNGNSSPAVNDSGVLPPVSNRTSENTIPAKRPANEIEDESETQNKKPRFRESEQHATPSYGIEVAEDGRYIASGAPLKRSRGRSVDEESTPTKKPKIVDSAGPNSALSSDTEQDQLDEPSPPLRIPNEPDESSNSSSQELTAAHRPKAQTNVEIPLSSPRPELGHLLRAQKVKQPARLRHQAESFLRQKRKLDGYVSRSSKKYRLIEEWSRVSLWPGSAHIPGSYEPELGDDDAILLHSWKPRHTIRNEITTAVGSRSRTQYSVASIELRDVGKPSTPKKSSDKSRGL